VHGDLVSWDINVLMLRGHSDTGGKLPLGKGIGMLYEQDTDYPVT